MPTQGDLCVAFVGTKQRRCVILRVDAQTDAAGVVDVRLLVIAGTSTPGEPSILIDHKERTGRNLQLQWPTYFRKGYIAVVRAEKVKLLPGRCSPERLFALLDLVGVR